jgi:hypothetical protein
MLFTATQWAATLSGAVGQNLAAGSAWTDTGGLVFVTEW